MAKNEISRIISTDKVAVEVRETVDIIPDGKPVEKLATAPLHSQVSNLAVNGFVGTSNFSSTAELQAESVVESREDFVEVVVVADTEILQSTETIESELSLNKSIAAAETAVIDVPSVVEVEENVDIFPQRIKVLIIFTVRKVKIQMPTIL